MSFTRRGALAGTVTILSVIHAVAEPIATTRATTNLRKAPGIDSEIVIRIPKGATVAVGDCREGWCLVSWNGQDGYVIARNVGKAAVRQWSNAPVVWPGGYGSSQRIRTAREHEEHEREESGFSEHSFVLEIGAAGEWSVDGERPNFGGTIAGEVEPIENWLELEFGITTLTTAGHTELSGDLLFKKPFRLSPTTEFMVGAGPSFSRTLSGPEPADSWNIEFAVDWMFWPTKNLGWFIEPTWSVNPKNGKQAGAVSIGILIGFPTQ